MEAGAPVSKVSQGLPELPAGEARASAFNSEDIWASLDLAAAAERTSISAEVRVGSVDRTRVTALRRLTEPLRHRTSGAVEEEAVTTELLQSVGGGAGDQVSLSFGAAIQD